MIVISVELKIREWACAEMSPRLVHMSWCLLHAGRVCGCSWVLHVRHQFSRWSLSIFRKDSVKKHFKSKTHRQGAVCGVTALPGNHQGSHSESEKGLATLNYLQAPWAALLIKMLLLKLLLTPASVITSELNHVPAILRHNEHIPSPTSFLLLPTYFPLGLPAPRPTWLECGLQ